MSKPSVLLVSYHFYPSPEVGAKRPSETALFLHRSGFDVTVLRGLPWDCAATIPERLRELRIMTVVIPRKWLSELWLKLKTRRSPATAAQPARAASASSETGSGAAGRARLAEWLRRQVTAFESLLQGDKKWFLKSVLTLLLRRRRVRFDAVIASGPPMAGYICGTFAAWAFRAKLILDLRDPWYLHGDPERNTDAPGHPLCALENSIGRYCISRTDHLVVASPGIERHLRETFGLAHGRVDLIRNGFDESTVVGTKPPVGRLNMLYAGTLYWNRNPFPLLEALAIVCAEEGVSRSSIGFKLVGRCSEWNEQPLHPWLIERGIDDVVEVMPSVDPAELKRLVEASNVLVNFSQGQPRQIPAKSYEYLASGREVLTVAETGSDVSSLFAEAGFGAVVEPADSSAMLHAIRGYYRQFVVEKTPGRSRPDVQRFSRAAQLVRFANVLNEAVRR